MKKQLELLSSNSQKGAAFWPTLLLILVILGLPFGIGFFIGRAGGASSVQVSVPKPTAEDPGQLKMVQPRWGHTATVLASGRILIQGGYKTAPSGTPAQAEPAELTEIFDPLTQRFALAQEADLAEAGQQTWPSILETPSSISLANGGSLIFGLDGVFLELTGASSMVSLTSLWDTNVPSLLRYGGTAIPLNGTYANPDGTTTTYEFNHRILVVGGLDAAGNPQDAAVFNPAKLSTDMDDYYPGDPVVLTGSGWAPNEEVDLYVVDDLGWEYKGTVTMDAQGSLSDTVLFDVLEQHLGVTFSLTGIGADSGYVAKVTFTDSPKVGSVVVGTQVGTPSYGTSSSATYVVTVNRGSGSGSSGNFTATLTITGLPAGATGSFSPNPVSLSSSESSDTATLTVTTAAGSPAAATSFTVKAETSASDFATGNGTLTINKKTLTASVTANNKVYDGNTTATIATRSLPGVLAGDAVTLVPGTATFNNKNIGTGKTVTESGLSLSGADAGNYQLSSTTATTTANITALAITGSITANSKVYDGNNTATIATRTLTGAIAGDAVSYVGGTATFNNKNVGTAKPVTATGLSLSGADAGNYTVNSTAATTADITARALVVTASASSKAYDGTTAATVTLSDNRVSGDNVTIAFTLATFDTKGVGTGKTVTVSGITISGADAGNYTVNTSATTTADITARALAVTATAANKVYDGTTAASVTLADNRVSGDILTTASTSATFDTKNVGTGKTVTVSGITISGADAGNYTVNTSTTSTADITARALSVTATAANKVYDGTTTASVTLADNRVSGDVLTTASTSATFDNKNVGTGKTVTVSGITISGTDAGNYTVNTSTTTTADITARALLVTATAANKVYDGTAAASVTLADNRVSGDLLTTASTSATFDSKDVGTGKTVTVSGITISGIDAGNYTVNTSTTTTADITARALLVTAAAANKIYDGTTAASVTLLDNRVSGDSLTAASASATFDTKDVGNGKTVTVNGITISGTDAGNYTVNTSTMTTADITARALLVTATAANKAYDGTTVASVTLLDNRVSGDVLTTASTSALFDDKNVGTGKTVTVNGITISGTDAGNYTVNTSTTTTADITARGLLVTATALDKVYDGTTAASVTLLDNRVSGDVLTIAFASALFDDKNVGTGKTVTVSGITISGTDAGNYTVNSSTTTTADITVRTLSVTATAANKVYNGTTAASVTLLDNRVSGDVLTIAFTAATFDTKNVGTGKTVTVSGITMSGTDADNYSHNTTTSTTADITARSLTITATGINKAYDGNTAATVTLSDDKVSGDAVLTSYASASFDTKDVGTGKTVTVLGISISGGDAGNYTFNDTATTTADITARQLIITATGVNKVYDGTTAATVTLSDDKVDGDDVVTAYAMATFDTKHVGTGKTVSVTGISISGADAGNYTFNDSATTTADITARPLTISATGINKVYDGTTAATVTLSNDKVAGDDVTAAYTTATFNNKNVGTSKPVSVTGISITGTDAGNYTFNTTASTTADITARVLTVSAAGINKVYDSTAVATVTLSDNRVSGDVFTTSYTSASFSDKNVGTGKTVSVLGISIAGVDAGNYTFNTTASTTADITARALVVTATGINKVYDGMTTATVTLSDDRVAGDVFTTSYAVASFGDKNVGTGKPVSVSGISIVGVDAGNYTFNTTASTTADITARPLTISATGINKIYDGTTAATVTLADDRVSGDVFTTSYTAASFGDKNVGTGKSVSVTGISITGTDAGNYTFNTTASTAADITARALTVSAAGINKVYDSTAVATVTLSDNRVSGDVFTTSYTSASFDDKNVGAGKTVSVLGISIAGVDAGNYTFNTTASTTADITARGLVVTATGINKVYDGTTAATVTLSDDRVAGDVFTTSYAVASFGDKNVGTGKPVSVSGISIVGVDAGNYTFNTTASTTADITARPLTISATGINKIYDGTTVATVTLSDDRVSGDVFTTSYTAASFGDKNVGTGKSVSVTGVSITGTDAGNYTFNTTASTTADITTRALTVTATGVNKGYDSTTAATVTLSDDRVSGDVFTASYAVASFGDKNVGTGKPVSVSGISISGLDAGNYTFNTTASTTADITARALTITATGVNKVYDGTTAATVTLSDDKVDGDEVTTAYSTATFNNKNVGAGKPVSVAGISISGADAGNYTFNDTASTTADITTRVLTVTATGINKAYDGTTTATVTLSNNKVAGDDVTASYTSATFNNKNVGTGKPVSVSGISISGADAGNYTFNDTASTTADITAQALTVVATGVDKAYDGTAAATVTLSDDRVLGDVFTTSYTSASFNDKNVGLAKLVSVLGISISGADAGNYTFNTTASTTANISARSLTVTATGVDKIYNGTAVATVTLSNNKVSGDDIATSYTAAAFDNKNVGLNKPVSVSGISISGADAGNYTFNTTASTTANISARALTITAIAADKIYDGNAVATVTLSDDRVAGDSFATSYGSANFDNKNVASGKTVTVLSIAIAGGDAANYTFNDTATATAAITARPLAIAAAGVNKVYDGNATATVTLSDDRVAGDMFTSSYTSASFNDKNVGTSKPVSVSGISITGIDAGNYTFNTTANTTANITQLALVVAAEGLNKTYDGGVGAFVTLSHNALAGDDVAAASGSAVFDDKNVGVNKPVSVSGIVITGADAANYTYNATAETAADILARDLAVTATGINKVYDSTTAATVTLADDKVDGDLVTLNYSSASFADKNVGAGKPVSVSGISISGGDAGNYLANTTASTTADITSRGLLVTATGLNKVYDSTAAATVTLAGNPVSGDEVDLAYAAASFNNKNVGIGKPVSVSGIALSGPDAPNYTQNTTASTTADITSRPLVVTATGINKVYDGTTVASVTLSASPLAGDTVVPSYVSASFADKNVGTAKPVTVSGITIAGADAGNYAQNVAAATIANITERPITVTADAKVKECGDADPMLTYQVTSGNLVSGDAFSGALSRSLGESLGAYAILKNSLTAGPNYALAYVGANLTIQDTRPPTIACPANKVVSTGSLCASATPVTFTVPSGADGCGIASVVCAPASGSAFAVGVTTVTCTATDVAGNTTQCSFTVTVQQTPVNAETIGACVDRSRVHFGNQNGSEFAFFRGDLKLNEGNLVPDFRASTTAAKGALKVTIGNTVVYCNNNIPFAVHDCNDNANNRERWVYNPGPLEKVFLRWKDDQFYDASRDPNVPSSAATGNRNIGLLETRFIDHDETRFRYNFKDSTKPITITVDGLVLLTVKADGNVVSPFPLWKYGKAVEVLYPGRLVPGNTIAWYADGDLSNNGGLPENLIYQHDAAASGNATDTFINAGGRFFVKIPVSGLNLSTLPRSAKVEFTIGQQGVTLMGTSQFTVNPYTVVGKNWKFNDGPDDCESED